MLSFKEYLIEANFSEDDFSRVISVFSKRLPKLLGSPLHRYGGAGHVRNMHGYNDILYIFDNKAFAVRFKGGHVLGIDVWTHFTTNTAPSYFIDVHELKAGSLIGSISKLASLIKNPKEGEYQVKSLNEEHLTEMAKRVGDESFYKLLVDKYGEKGAEAVSWAQIKIVADENDVQIPSYIRNQKIGRGLWNAKPGASSSDAQQSSNSDVEPVQKDGHLLYIKVTAQDPKTKKFVSAADSKEAQALYKQIASSMSQHKPTDKELRDPETLYGHLSQLVGMACKGTLRSLLIYGGPGTGKTYTIMKTISDEGMVAGKDYVKLSGKASPLSIYQTLFMYRDGGLVLFDDLDSMWGNQDATNILKAALDTSPVREIAWGSSNTINVSKMSDEKKQALFKQIDAKISGEDVEETDDGEDDDSPKIKKGGPVKFPSQFDFKGRVIFISNLKKEEFDSAIMSRSAKINMDLTPEEILQRMRTVLPTLGGDDVPVKKKEELLDHLIHMHGKGDIDAVTMREFVKGLNILRSGVANWKDLIQYS